MMANENSFFLQRWRHEIESRDPDRKILEGHRKEIDGVQKSARQTLFWSFVSLFYILGNMHIGVRETHQNTDGEISVWGIPIFGISEKTFLTFLLIMTSYRAIIFLFLILKIHMVGNLLLALKEIICASQYDAAWKEARLEENSVTETDEEYRRNRDVWLFMMDHRFMGMLEYFFAPILFPALLSLAALVMLATRVYF